MKRILVLAALIAAPAANAQTNWDQPAQARPTLDTQSPEPHQQTYLPAPDPSYRERQPALPLYSPPTVYPKQETFGDSRPYRESNPTTCTGLLCN